jgi:hypothetical protein
MYKKIRTGYTALIIIACIASLNPVSGQRREKPAWGYGGSIIYNFATEGFGADLRVKIPVRGHLFAVPEVSYFPSFNRYHELYAGVALHYEIIAISTYKLYLAGGGYYNSWLNADDFVLGQRKQNNFVPEAGAGLVRSSGCIRPFIENRYDFKWKENNLRIGILFYPGSCGRKKEKCPPSPT